MEYESYEKVRTVIHTLNQMSEGILLLRNWNSAVVTVNDYLTSVEGMQKLAASCMMLESFGESYKKIDKLLPNFLLTNAPEFSWKELKGLRDVIAHGYFKIDAELILSIIKDELDNLETSVNKLKIVAENEI